MNFVAVCILLLISCFLGADALPTISEAHRQFDNQSNFGLMFVRFHRRFSALFQRKYLSNYY